jgi:hypothetical protein
MVKLEIDNAVLSIDSTRPDRHGVAKWTGDFASLSEWLPYQVGMFGHIVSDMPTPMDAIAALNAAGKKYQVIEGQEILDLPMPELPEGVMS